MCVKLLSQLFVSFALYREGEFQRQTVSICRALAVSLTNSLSNITFPRRFYIIPMVFTLS